MVVPRNCYVMRPPRLHYKYNFLGMIIIVYCGYCVRAYQHFVVSSVHCPFRDLLRQYPIPALIIKSFISYSMAVDNIIM